MSGAGDQGQLQKADPHLGPARLADLVMVAKSVDSARVLDPASGQVLWCPGVSNSPDDIPASGCSTTDCKKGSAITAC